MSSGMMRELMHDILASCSDRNWDWTFLDAPNEPTGPVRRITRERWPAGPYREWWNATEQADGSVKYLGLDRSLDLLRKLLSEGEPYDILAGYSQGATLVSALTALAERSDFLPAERAWRGALLFNSGVTARDPALAPLYAAGPLRMPSIHVLGGPSDVLYESQKAMLAHWDPEKRTVLEHDEGHVPPSRAASEEVIAALRHALERLLA
jgi:hypothetical protein